MAFESGVHRAAGVRRAMAKGPALEMRAMAVEFPEVLGQPGRLHHLEQRVSRNEQGVQRMRGITAAFGTALTMMHFAISYFTGKHH
ncbi:hypothetical protein [Granulicella tundricola]|uniref:Uncharacterized protein n=1 Tax=Granulicella tundricola (strain ATCC BAA-1859 / DSM 23138 / MP5ACTX9) TaxID=1198114 RepID=E8X460_GRATM|nr:hypothetical protein [Granulicella tundricola]ADW67120.1 hypothetical protein AciX9_0029 [Granulicella tundricola MP5ACTX9]